MPRASSPGSVYSISSGETSDYAPESTETTRPTKRARLSGTAQNKPKARIGSKVKQDIDDIEDAGPSILRPHASSYHSVEGIVERQKDLLDWFEVVREKRGMPWRKRYDPSLTMEEKGQRAYEIWVSEVMLQQTQVNTVIAYWQRWIDKWPTIADLAKADIEEVNAAWRGLGYYRRARSLLEGAKTVMAHDKYKGRLPNDPDVLEKEISGVGRYTAGAICSMAYGIRTPIVDGNIHRLFTRLLAVHAPQTAPSTIKFLWSVAEELVDKLPKGDGRRGVAGDWNQALMELGSQVCKPVAPLCSECPFQARCKAYAETIAAARIADGGSDCTLCAPIPSSIEAHAIPTVTIFPMRKVKKTSRSEDEVVCVTEWRCKGEQSWLFVKRPEKGLLAGLFEPPTTPTEPDCTKHQRLEIATRSVAALLNIPKSFIASATNSHRDIGSIPHIFSHIDMTYHVQHLVIESADPPPTTSDARAVWLDDLGVEHANVGTGVKKVWAEIFGAWGNFEAGPKGTGPPKKAKTNAVKPKAQSVKLGEKLIKKVMMPSMPNRK